MTRDELAAYLGLRFGAYLEAVNREATDTPGNLQSVIDDTLRALGTAYGDLATTMSASDAVTDDWIVQGSYRTMLQVTRDLGATSFDLSTSGDSFKLSQLRIAAEKDLEQTRLAVLEWFGTTGVVSLDGSGEVFTFDLNYLTPDAEAFA